MPGAAFCRYLNQLQWQGEELQLVVVIDPLTTEAILGIGCIDTVLLHKEAPDMSHWVVRNKTVTFMVVKW